VAVFIASGCHINNMLKIKKGFIIMLIFDRFITPNLKKRIAVFKRNSDGCYTHKTYGSLLEMPEQERMEYIMNEIGSDAVEEQILARYNYIKNKIEQKMRNGYQHDKDY